MLKAATRWKQTGSDREEHIAETDIKLTGDQTKTEEQTATGRVGEREREGEGKTNRIWSRTKGEKGKVSQKMNGGASVMASPYKGNYVVGT